MTVIGVKNSNHTFNLLNPIRIRLLEGIPTTAKKNDIELNDLIVNDLMVSKILVDDILNSTDTTALEDIFSQHWLPAGNSVYSAAAILFKEYYSPSISFRLMDLSQHSSSVNNNLNIFPNPAKKVVYFSESLSSHHLIKLYDGSGRIILSKPFVQELNISNIEEGFYIIKIYNGNEVVFNKSLIKIE